MPTKTSQKSSNTLLIFILVLITFPFWIGFFGMAMGIVGGVFGVVFGVLGGVLGAVMSVITLPFKIIFGHDHWFPHVNGYVIAVLLILVLILVKKRSA